MKCQRSVLKNAVKIWSLPKRYISECLGTQRKGLIIGAYDGCSSNEIKLTPTALKLDEETGGKIKMVTQDGAGIRRGTAQVFTNLHNEFYSIAVAGLGPETSGMNEQENLEECKENIRWAAATGARALEESGIGSVFVENFTNAEAAAEGSILSVWNYQELRNKNDQYPKVRCEPYDQSDREQWQVGQVKAEAQNLARKIEEAPANVMTPLAVAQIAIDVLCPCGVKVDVKGRDWLESKNFTGFLTCSRSSCEEPLMLEVSYCGGSREEHPLVFVGKGSTFDTGGLSEQDLERMSSSRGDLAGVAVIIGMFKAAATMALPMNLKAYLPLCEFLLGGMSVKPGDVVRGFNGKTVLIENTQFEGRIIMMDPLSYSSMMHPPIAVTVASMTDGVKLAMGSGATAVFTNSQAVWEDIQRAGVETGDRVWRMPLWKYFSQKINSFKDIDVLSVNHKYGAGPCVGASFLQQFKPDKSDLLHLDISGTGLTSTGVGHPYLRKGLMTGRPVRTLVEYLYQRSCPHAKGDQC